MQIILPSIPSTTSTLPNKKYTKVTEYVRNQFLELIVYANMSIKDASQMLNINYSSAKAILAAHKKTLLCKKSRPQLSNIISGYRVENQERVGQIGVVSSVGGLTRNVLVSSSSDEHYCASTESFNIVIPQVRMGSAILFSQSHCPQ